MLRNLLLAAMACFFAAVVAATMILGGCAGKRVAVPAAGGRQDLPVAEDIVEVGRNARTIARLAVPVDAVADVYDADADGFEQKRVRILAGAWLMPATAFLPPERLGDKE